MIVEATLRLDYDNTEEAFCAALHTLLPVQNSVNNNVDGKMDKSD